MLKTCGKCKQAKPLAEFHKNSRTKDGLQDRCNECHKGDVRAAYAANPAPYLARVKARAVREPAKIARNSLRQVARVYGLDPDEVEDVFNAHGGTCDICREPPDPTWKRHSRLVIDHDHSAPGHFRGLLCAGCNIGLASFADEPRRMSEAIKYLTEGVRLLSPYVRGTETRPRRKSGEGGNPNHPLRLCAVLRGLDANTIEDLFKAHNGFCDICGSPPPATCDRNRRLAIDHDHNAPGIFRGFLCYGCNFGLGNFKDDPVRITSAIQYLAASAAKLADAA